MLYDPYHFLIARGPKYRTSHCSLYLQHCSRCAVSCTHFTTALCPLSRCWAVTRRSEGWSSVATGPGVKKVDCILQFSISSQHRAVLHSPGSQLQHCSCTPDTMLCCSDGHDSLSPLPSCRLIISPAHHASVLQSVLHALCSAADHILHLAVCKKWEHKPITAELTMAGNTLTAAHCSNAAIPTPSVSVCHCSTTHASNILTMGSPGNSLLMTATLAPHLDN